MVSAVEVAFALLPLVVAAVLLVGLLWSATRAMPIAWLTAVASGAFVWGMPPEWLAAASLVGVMTALEILWIVFGALVLLYTLMRAGAIERINRGFASISNDRRVQVILLAFFLATFLEGVAGFGTPAAVVAPLLLGLGFPALAAVVAALIGHAVATTYGAVGTPIIVGLESPLSDAGFVNEALEDAGMSVPEFALEAAAWGGVFNALAGIVMPIITVGTVVYFFGEERSLEPVYEVLPLCLFAGIVFSVPYWAGAWFIGAEFPALIGTMVGGSIVVVALRAGYFRPEDEWEFPPREDWPDHWIGDIEPGTDEFDGEAELSLLAAWLPYLVLVVLLVLTRVVGPIEEALMEFGPFVIEWSGILGTTLGEEIEWAFMPGTWLIVSALVATMMFRMSPREISGAWREAAGRLVEPLVALVFVIAMVQIMLQSGEHAEIDSMIVVLAEATAGTFGPAYPAVAALIGALGTAVAGSSTVSNITFGAFQFEAATLLDLPRELIVGAQTAGSAIGNPVAIHNVIAALATVGLVGEEGRVIRLNLLPTVIYTVIVGLATLVFVYVLFPGVY
jgi:lactate permease